MFFSCYKSVLKDESYLLEVLNLINVNLHGNGRITWVHAINCLAVFKIGD